MKKDRSRSTTAKAIITLALVFVSVTALFYRYIFVMRTSDFPAHIENALSGSDYSINILFMPLFYKLTGSNLGIVLLMSLVIIGTVLGMALFMRTILKKLEIDREYVSLIPLASSLLFISKLCLPEWSPFYYKGAFVTQPWHNSTYIMMRAFAIPTLMMYFVIRRDYLKELKIRDCVLFTFFLFLTNCSKPNFLIAFAPVMLAVLVYDFVRTKGKSFKNAFFFGVCVLISMSIIMYQYMFLFPEGGESRIVFSVAHAISDLTQDKKMPLYLLLNYLFPGYVSYLFIRNRDKMDRFSRQLFREGWAMDILTIFISLFVAETGPRAKDGNFRWGNRYFGLVIFMICAVILYAMKKKGLLTPEEYTTARIIYIMHIVFGVFYFLTLFIGVVSWVV